MKTKDFLFFNYNWVPNSTFIFESFRKMGHEIDIIGEEELRTFRPDCKYKNVVLYLHEGWSIPMTNHIIDNYCQDSFLQYLEKDHYNEVLVKAVTHQEV